MVEERNSEKLCVLYSTNKQYAVEAGISIISLLENNKMFATIKIYFIDCGLTEEQKMELTGIVADYDREIVFVSLTELVLQYPVKAPNPSYYGRFFAPFFVEEDKLLYFDADLVIVDSLMDLWNTDIDGYSIGAVQGIGSISMLTLAEKLKIPKETRYVNSGVLLVNLEYWRANHIAEDLLDYLNTYGEIPPLHDQNILNKICYRHTKILHPRYNLAWSMICCKPQDLCKLNKIVSYYTEEELAVALKEPCVIHYNNSFYGRPWYKDCKHPYKDWYLKYRALSPWKEIPLPKSNIPISRRIRNNLYVILPGKAYCIVRVIGRYEKRIRGSFKKKIWRPFKKFIKRFYPLTIRQFDQIIEKEFKKSQKEFKKSHEKFKSLQEKFKKSQEKLEKSQEKLEKTQVKFEKTKKKLEKSQEKFEKSQEMAIDRIQQLKQEIKEERQEIKRLQRKMTVLEDNVAHCTPKPELSFSVGLTEHCDLNCAGCARFAPLAEPEFADYEETARDFARLSTIFRGQARRIRMVGGEPLLHPDIAKFLKMARENFPDSDVSILTNGVRLMDMPEEFWQACKENNIVIRVTKYPISLKFEEMEKLAAKYGVEYCYFNDAVVVEKAYLPRMDVNGLQDERRSFLHCSQANQCLYLQHGRLYTCTVVPTARHFNKCFGEHFKEYPEDSIDIYKTDSAQEILEFLAKPIPFCRYCAPARARRNLPWHQSERAIEEWT